MFRATSFAFSKSPIPTLVCKGSPAHHPAVIIVGYHCSVERRHAAESLLSRSPKGVHVATKEVASASPTCQDMPGDPIDRIHAIEGAA